MKAQPKVKGVPNLSAPHEIPEYQPADIYAIKALILGEANADQQSRIVKWIEKATAVGEMSYRPGDDGRRASDFAEGKRFVGLQFFTLAKALMPERDNSRT